jgi:hypothetical protein
VRTLSGAAIVGGGGGGWRGGAVACVWGLLAAQARLAGVVHDTGNKACACQMSTRDVNSVARSAHRRPTDFR